VAPNFAWWEAFPTVLWRIGGRYALFAGLAFLLFYVWKRSAWSSNKIQPRFPGKNDLRREVFYSSLTILIFAAVVTVVMFHPQVRAWTQLMDLPNQRGWLYYFLIFPVLLFLHDAYFYWAHRLMHLPWLYKRVHRVHHQSTNPSPWAAYSFHPWEALVEVGILPLFVMGLPLHKSHVVLFFLFMIVYNVYGHLGYELYPASFLKSKWGSWVNTSRHHNLHHARFQGNYGLYFLIWDRWMGTLKTAPETPVSKP
jgi:sterol desaturase/sphingolipid hydroxylase (fatty acid hydroxylase superfamily)